MPRYVILTHDHPFLHWDLMLEVEGGLRTWRLSAPPAPGIDIRAEPLGLHRAEYLDYEGPVSGGRGHVQRWDAGQYTQSLSTDTSWEATVRGSVLNGVVRLSTGDGQMWTFVYQEAGVGRQDAVDS